MVGSRCCSRATYEREELMLVDLVGGPLGGQRADVTPWSDEYAAPMLPDGFIAWYLGIPTREIKHRRRPFAVYRRESPELRRRMVFVHMEVR
jgi:hypothetical protein